MSDNLRDIMQISSNHHMDNFANDSLHNINFDSSSIFTQSVSNEIVPKLILTDQYYFLGLGLLLLMFFISAIWYFLPEVLSNNFKSLTNNPLKRNWESTQNTSGLVVNTLLYLNYVVVFSFLIFMIVNNVIPEYLNYKMELRKLFPISLILLMFLLFRFLFISVSGFIFKTFDMASHQNRLYNSLDRGLGLFLLPVLLFSLYGNQLLFLSLSILTVSLFIVSRWVFTIVIGIRITKFSWFHIILYLCTLEIIPILILIKVLETEVFKVM